jgi:hypothetical protein
MVNWKIIVGGMLIFAGIAQLLRIFADYQYRTTALGVVGLTILFTGVVAAGFYLLKQGRKEAG